MGTVHHHRWVAQPTPTYPPLIITTASVPNVSINNPYSASLSATGGVPPYTWSLLSAVPNNNNWLSISSAGVLSGTPTTAETDVILVQVQDSLGTKASAFFTFQVIGTPLAIVTSSPLPNGTVGTAYSLPLTATGGTPPYTWALVSATPNTGAWVSVSSGGTLGGTPGTAETESITVKVTDSLLTSVTKALSLTVSAASTTLAFPRVMLVAVGGDQSYGSNAANSYTNWLTASAGNTANTAIQTIGAYDIAIISGTFEGWDSGGLRDRENLTRALLKNASYQVTKNVSRPTLTFYYCIMNATVSGNPNAQWQNLVSPNNWFLYESTGGTGVQTPAGGGQVFINCSSAWPTAIGSASIGASICGRNYGTTSNGSPTGTQGPARTFGNYAAIKLLMRGYTGDTRFAFNAQMGSPSAAGIFMDEVFVALDGAGTVPDSSLDGISIAPGSQQGGGFPGLDTVQPVMARGIRNMFDQLQTMTSSFGTAGKTYYNFGNFGQYANKYQFGTATLTAGLDNLQGGLLENVLGAGASSWECYQIGNTNTGNTTYPSGWPNLLANYYQGMDFCLAPKLVGLGTKLPSTDGTATASWPIGAGSTLSTVTTGTALEYQLMRYGLCTTLLDDGYFAPGIGGYDWSKVRWYDEYGDDSLVQVNVKRGYLGTPLTTRPTSPTWAQGPMGVWSRQFTNGIAIVNPRGNGAQTVTLPQQYQALSGTQQPTINNGALVTSVTIPDGDGRIYVLPATNAPLMLYVDAPVGPTTGGENNLGSYLNIFGVFPNAFLNSDGTTNISITIGGVAVANLRCCVPAVISGRTGVAGLGLNAITRIGCQIGPLTGLAQNGTYYPIVVKIGGVAPRNSFNGSAYLDLDNHPIQYCPNPGYIVFVDPVNGNDANPGTFASPLKTVQSFNSGTGVFTGAFFGPTSSGSPSQTNQVQPGTHVVCRSTGLYQTLSFGSRWWSAFRQTGTAPNGATPAAPVSVTGPLGTIAVRASGPLVLTSYPGPINGNAPETAYNNETSSGQGGFNGNDSARANETSIWNTVGWGKHIYICNVRIDVPAGAPGDGAPINLQSNQEFHRVVNCYLGPWASNINATAAGITGYGNDGVRYGNYIPGITSASGQQNHSMYFDGNVGGGTLSGSQMGEVRTITAYNVCTGTTGTACQMRGTGLNTEAAADCVSIHHNWFDASNGKYGVDFTADNDGTNGRIQAKVWNNVCINGLSGIFTNSGLPTVNNGIQIVNNLIYGWRTYGAIHVVGLGLHNIENNISLQIVGQPHPAFSDFVHDDNGFGTYVYNKNVWFDPTGFTTTLPSGDTTGIVSDPKLVSPSTSNFVPGVGSPAVNFGTTPELTGLVTLDFNYLTRPQGANTKCCAGPYERPGG